MTPDITATARPTLSSFLMARVEEQREWARMFSRDAPAREHLLADADAKESLVRHLAAVHAVARTADEGGLADVLEVCEFTLKTLAATWAGHDDYRPEWRLDVPSPAGS